MRFPEVETALRQFACEAASAVGLSLALALLVCVAPVLAAARGLPLRAALLGAAVPACLCLDGCLPFAAAWCALTTLALLPRPRDRVVVDRPSA